MGQDLADAVLDALDEPVFLVDPNGGIAFSNRAAGNLLGSARRGGTLLDLVEQPHEALIHFLRRCSGTTQTLPGAATLRDVSGELTRFRLRGARTRAKGAPYIFVRCLHSQRDQFPVLAAKIRELNAEIHQRRRIQATLEESLRNNEVLLRELHHRVKNNLQMLIGLMAAAQRETSSDEARSILEEVVQRITAIGSFQRLMHESQEIRTISSAPFVQAICDATATTIGDRLRIEVRADDGELSHEVGMPLALILNELLTNAAKHAGGRIGGSVRVGLFSDDQGWELVVHDNGPGLPPDPRNRRSSGLGLVKGLCRQLGASLKLENANGARFVIRFGRQEQT
ncbi:sensor histidine kinase [Pseudorhizobium marinum]|uniref:sensor histidine kinase n=1 Tax=Pseudorhizobium marinum TaxID=1496690 RepID=UPI0004958267|nr:histidine kinase dimerization/phosphoacceptor domain -containing protein [Pseudorhizobium marinum]